METLRAVIVTIVGLAIAALMIVVMATVGLAVVGFAVVATAIGLVAIKLGYPPPLQNPQVTRVTNDRKGNRIEK
ncbi:MAG: hypothetical protein AAGC96_02195 [Pseudomonadota bacterium]